MKQSQQSDFCNEVKFYFYEINKYKPLSFEEERIVGKKVKEGDELATEKLILSNLKFVVMIAKSYKTYGLPFSDLIAEGNIGLIKAAKKFDFNKENKFISYAVWWIKQSIQDYIKRNVSVNVEVQGIFTPPEKSANEDGYVDNVIDVEDDNEIEHEQAKVNILSELMECLSKRENDIITCYFGIGDNEEMTLEEIGSKYGLTKERVRQIKEKALIKLRSNALIYKNMNS